MRDYMMEQTVSLTSAEKSKIQNEKQLFVLLRMIQFIEKYYSYDKIDETTYKCEISKLIQKYKRFSQVVPNYSLEGLMKKYSIQPDEISWAKLVLDKGIDTEENKGKQTFYYMQAVAKFIQVLDMIDFKSDNPIVGELKTTLEGLHIILIKIKDRLGNQFIYKFLDYERMLKQYVQNKSINQSLTESQLKELKLSVEGMYNIMSLVMKS